MTGLSDITVNGVTIPAARIAAEAQNHPAPPGKPGLAWRAAARALALRELMLQEARALGLEPAPGEVAPGQVETADEALIRQLFETQLSPDAVDEATLEAHYAADPGRFRSPPLWEASHILLATQAEAQAVLARALVAPQQFADLAQAHSTCPSGKSGGRLGQFGPGEMAPEVEVALRSMDPGQIAAQPVASRFGWHVLRLDARAEGAVLPYAAVRARLVQAAEKAAWARAARHYAQALIERARIEGIDLEPGHPVAA